MKQIFANVSESTTEARSRLANEVWRVTVIAIKSANLCDRTWRPSSYDCRLSRFGGILSDPKYKLVSTEAS